MQARFERPTRMPIWIAGVSECLLTALGAIVIARSIPVSYAGIPGENAPSWHGAAPGGSEDAATPRSGGTHRGTGHHEQSSKPGAVRRVRGRRIDAADRAVERRPLARHRRRQGRARLSAACVQPGRSPRTAG